MKHKNTQPSYIFNRENPQNSETQNGPRRGLDFIALTTIVPDIVFFAVDFPVSHEASALLIEKLLALTTLEAGRMPLQVGRYT